MRKTIYLILTAALMLAACSGGDIKVSKSTNQEPQIYPDYKGVTVPPNIAPLDFNYLGPEKACLIIEGKGGEEQIKADKGLFEFGEKQWRRLMESNTGGSLKLTIAVEKDGVWTAMKPFYISVAREPIDPYISYRLIPPGYEGWYNMGIYQRNVENYDQTPIFENRLGSRNCVNCHSYRNGDPDHLMFHSRASFPGTMVIQGSEIEKLNTKTDSTISALVYPYWHPSGRYIAFGVNSTFQTFYSKSRDKIEVFDKASDVVVYDVKNHEIAWSPLTKSERSLETFPAFSPDGRSLYFCSAEADDSIPFTIEKVKYSLVRIGFNPQDMSFGTTVDTLYNARTGGRSVSLPRVSPDGKWLVFVLHKFGTFSIWHKDADLYAVNLSSGKVYPLTAANSNDVESYHSWSRNSHWMVFSSRRDDGLFTRPYFTYIDDQGQAHKPFMLPQRNPRQYYERLMYSYNIPELMTGPVKMSEARITKELRQSPGVDVKVKNVKR